METSKKEAFFESAQKSLISDKRTLYLIVAIVLVAGLILSFVTPSGHVIVGSPTGDLGKCRDSDGGEEPYMPGIASYSNRLVEYKDECYARGGSGKENFLREYHCLDKIVTTKYLCYEGCFVTPEGVGYCGEGEIRIVDYQ